MFDFEKAFNGSPIKNSALRTVSPDEIVVGDEIVVTKSQYKSGWTRGYLGEIFIPVVVEKITPKRTKITLFNKNSGKKVLSNKATDFIRDYGTLYKPLPEMLFYNDKFLQRKRLLAYLQEMQNYIFSAHDSNKRQVYARALTKQVFDMPDKEVAELLEKFSTILKVVEKFAAEALKEEENIQNILRKV